MCCVNKNKIITYINAFGGDIDICEVFNKPIGIGCRELQFWSTDGKEIYAENNLDEDECEDYLKLRWDELSTYEQERFEYIIENDTPVPEYIHNAILKFLGQKRFYILLHNLFLPIVLGFIEIDDESNIILKSDIKIKFK